MIFLIKKMSEHLSNIKLKCTNPKELNKRLWETHLKLLCWDSASLSMILKSTDRKMIKFLKCLSTQKININYPFILMNKLNKSLWCWKELLKELLACVLFINMKAKEYPLMKHFKKNLMKLTKPLENREKECSDSLNCLWQMMVLLNIVKN